MTVKKALFLLALLAVPFSLFLFLHFFGSNKFEVPIYYEQGVDSLSCHSSTKPHTIPHFSLDESNTKKVTDSLLLGKLSVVMFYNDDILCKKEEEALLQLDEVFKTKGLLQFINIVSIENNMTMSNSNVVNHEVFYLKGKDSDLNELMRCGFIISDYNERSECYPVVLVDRKKQIRGYYYLSNREELDRMIDEIAILLKY